MLNICYIVAAGSANTRAGTRLTVHCPLQISQYCVGKKITNMTFNMCSDYFKNAKAPRNACGCMCSIYNFWQADKRIFVSLSCWFSVLRNLIEAPLMFRIAEMLRCGDAWFRSPNCGNAVVHTSEFRIAYMRTWIIPDSEWRRCGDA